MTENTVMRSARGRVVLYWLAGLGFVLGCEHIIHVPWRGSIELHTHMEIVATLLATTIGAMALVRYYSRKDNTFLFIGAGLLGTAFLDGYHALVTSKLFHSYIPSDLPSLIPWSWVASRQFLSILIFLSFLAWLREERLGDAGRIRERTVYAFSAAFTLLSFLFFAFVPLPQAYYPEILFPRPVEFAPALFFLLALIGYLKKGRWRADSFEHWLVLSLIVAFVSQAVYMSHSARLFDYGFDSAHLLKIVSYVFILIGLLANMLSIFHRAESGEGRFRGAIASLQEGFALYDADDRLVIFNSEFERLHSGIRDLLKPGLRFEELLRASVTRGLLVDAIDNEEEHIRERLAQHRNPRGPIVRELSDGTWYIISESRTPDGGIAVTDTDITELKNAEAALRDSEALMRLILEASPVGILVATREGKRLFANERALEIQGVSREELFSTKAGSYYADPDLRMKIKDDLYKTGSTPPTEVEFVKPDGTHYCAILSSTLTEFEGQAAHLSYLYDITELKNAEEALRDSEALTRRILEASPVGVLIATREGQHLFANERALEIQGVSRDELFSTNAANYYADPEIRKKMKNDLYKTGSTPPTEVELVKPDGTRYFVILSSTLTEFEGQTAHLTYMYDITERKEAERAIRESEARTRAIVDNIVDGIITIDESGIIISVNHAAERIFGYLDGELVGQNVSILAAEPHQSAHDRYLANYMTTGEAKIIGRTMELEGRKKNGRRFPLELAVNELKLGDEQLFVGIVRDNTARKEMDRMKQEFVSTVSHELRTPLTSIRGSLGLVTGGTVGKITKKAKEMIDMAEKNTDRLINLVNDILDMEKIESGNLEFRFGAVDLTKLVELSIDANKGFAEQYGVPLELVETQPDVMVRGDSDRLMQVLANLLSNAAKFSPEGGKVEVNVTKQNGRARISVSDHGPGIPEEFHETIFAKFTQADASDTRQVGGTGLGLNISKTIMEKHGGNIDFDTEAGVGTTFYFEIPILGETADDAEAL